MAVQTDASGAVGSCSQVHAGSPLSATDPGLTELTPNLTVTAPPISQSSAPAQTLTTTAAATSSQC